MKSNTRRISTFFHEGNSCSSSLITLLAVSSLTATGFSQTTYTWTGASSGDWTDETNWDANGVPVDNAEGEGNSAGLSLPPDGSIIILDGITNPLPTLNIPDLGGNGIPVNTPTVSVMREGTIDFIFGGREGSIWSNTEGTRDILSIGDGVGATTTVNVSSIATLLDLARHDNNATNNFQVNADGILNFNVDTVRFGWRVTNTGRHGTITIDGGEVNVAGGIGFISGVVGRFVNFTSPGGSFTAQFGDAGDPDTPNDDEQFIDIAEVTASLGVDFIASPGLSVIATDNGDNTFTVTTALSPDPNYWTGTGGTTWDQSSTANFTTNEEANALVVNTFDVASAFQNKVTFADEFFDSGVSQAVVETTASISGGGVSTDAVDFLNNDVDYLIDSSDTVGITGSTVVNLDGTGSVTFIGTHTYSGGTRIDADSTLNIGDGITDGSISDSSIINSGALVFNNTNAITHSAELTGPGTLEKLGAGTLTFSADSPLDGGTTITEGRIVFQEEPSAGSIAIASGTTLEIFRTAGIAYTGNVTISGDGTLAITGSGPRTRWAAGSATFELSADALIDIQGGNFDGGSNNNEIWTDNLSDLNVEAGALFRGVEANVRVDGLTGAGIISSGFDTASYMDFTIGVADGTATFAGVLENTTNVVGSFGNFTKVGTGTQTLAGVNTYTGNTTIESGTIILADGGAFTLAPRENGVNNVIAGVTDGTGILNLDGALNFDLTVADITTGNSWLVVDNSNLTVNYGATFTVATTTGSTFTDNGGVWTLSENGATWRFTEATGELQLVSLAGETITITATGFNDDGSFFIDVAEGIGFTITSSPDLAMDFTPVDNVTDDGANRFRIPAAALDPDNNGNDFFRVER